MKKLLLLSITAGICAFNAGAQQMILSTQAQGAVNAKETPGDPTPDNGKTTATGDTLYFHSNSEKTDPSKWNSLAADRAAPLDSGSLYGISALKWNGFAQLYRYSAINTDATKDTTFRVVGIMSAWQGRVGTSSTVQISLNVWDRGTGKRALPNRTKWFMVDAPGTSKASKSVAAPALAGASVSGSKAIATYLSAPLTGVNYDIYVGYTIAYTWGSTAPDTFGLRSTTNAATNYYTVDGTSKDTLLNVNNIVMDGGVWKSIVYDFGTGNGGDQVIYPIIQRECANCFPTSVAGITNQGLTFYGNYPNPAVNNTNIRFGLADASDVTIDIMDYTGKTITTVTKNNLPKGENTVNIETANLAAGNYVYLINAANGGHVASTFTVAK